MNTSYICREAGIEESTGGHFFVAAVLWIGKVIDVVKEVLMIG